MKSVQTRYNVLKFAKISETPKQSLKHDITTLQQRHFAVFARVCMFLHGVACACMLLHVFAFSTDSWAFRDLRTDAAGGNGEAIRHLIHHPQNGGRGEAIQKENTLS